jgi:hypothetical protein
LLFLYLVSIYGYYIEVEAKNVIPESGYYIEIEAKNVIPESGYYIEIVAKMSFRNLDICIEI